MRKAPGKSLFFLLLYLVLDFSNILLHILIFKYYPDLLKWHQPRHHRGSESTVMKLGQFEAFVTRSRNVQVSRPIEPVQKLPVVSPCHKRLRTRVHPGCSPRHRETRRFCAGIQSAVDTGTERTMASCAACSSRKPTAQPRKSSRVNSCHSADSSSSRYRFKSIIITTATNEHKRKQRQRQQQPTIFRDAATGSVATVERRSPRFGSCWRQLTVQRCRVTTPPCSFPPGDESRTREERE